MARNYETYDYYHSDVIGLDYAVRKDRCPADVVFEDGVIYTEEEQKALDSISKTIHNVKKIFEGTIIHGKHRRD